MTARMTIVRRSDDSVVFAIHAPAVAAALTRKANTLGADTLTALDISDAMCDRFANAFAGKPVVNFSFARNQGGRWFVEAQLSAPAKPAPKQCTHAPVADTNTQAKGNCKCHRCHGTGRIPSSRDNGLCYRCKGKGYTTEIDRRRNAGYAKHRKARIEAARRAADDLNRANRVA